MADRFEGLPPVDLDGWLADQGRNFLQQTDQQISRLGLPSFVSDTTQKIQGLGSDLSSIYGGLQEQLAARPAVPPPPPTPGPVSDFLSSTGDRIASLGQDLRQGIDQTGQDLGSSVSDALARSRETNVYDAARSGLDWVDQRFPAQPGGPEDQLALRQGSRPLGGLPSQGARAVRTGTKALRSSLAGIQQGASQIAGAEAERQAAVGRGDPVGANLASARGLWEAAQAGGSAVAAPYRAAGGAVVGGTLPPGSDRNVFGVPGDVPVLGGLGNPVQMGQELGELFQVTTLIDELVGVAVRKGIPLAKAAIGRLVRALGEGETRRVLEEGAEATTQALRRVAADEEGGLRLPGSRPALAPAPPTPPPPRGPPAPGQRIPDPVDDVELAYNHALQIEEGNRGAARTPGGPAPIDPKSPLATFDEAEWAGKWSRFRQLWTDENARLDDVQGAVEDLLGRPLPPEARPMLARRLYAGRGAAADQWLEDELTPVVRGLSKAQVADAERTVEQLDDVGRARAIQRRVTAEAAGNEVGPVAGETALRNTTQSLRMRRAQLGRALTDQATADADYTRLLAEQRRLRAEGRREVLGSQGRGRRRVQRTPAEQTQLEADVQRRLDTAREATVTARAARDEAARAANINLSKVTRADLRRMRLEGVTGDARLAAEREIAEGAALKGAEAASARRFSGGVTDVTYDDNTVWDVARRRVADRLGSSATPDRVDAELATVRRAVEGMQGFSRQLRARLHDAGILSDDLYEQWERDFPGYLRTNILKYMDEEAATGIPQGAQRFTVQSLVGGGQDVGARMSVEGTHALREQPLNTLIRMTHAAETLARRNENAQTLERLVQADPSGDLAKAFRPLKTGETPGPGEVAFAFYKNGEPVRYAVEQRFEGLFNLPPSRVRAALDAVGLVGLKGPVQQALTTYNPAFIGYNAMRDYQVYLRREARSPRDIVRATGEEVRAIGDLTGDALRRARLGPFGQTPRPPSAKTADLRQLIRAGGGQDQPWSGLTAQQIRHQMLLDPKVKDRATFVSNIGQVADALTKYTGVQAAGRTIRGIGNVVESAPRLAAGRRALARGSSPDEAALAMRDVTMDFSRGGTAARDLNRAIPFFNAAIQSSARFFGDDLQNRRGAVGVQAVTLLLAKAGLEAYNQTYGDDYADVPSYVKDTGLVFMLPGDVPRERRPDGSPVPGGRNYLWYPLPQDLVAPLRVGLQAYRRATGEVGPGWGTPQDFATSVVGLGADVGGALSPVPLEGGPPLPPVLDQAYEQLANRDLYRDRPIVPDYLADRPPEDQYTPQTSALGRVVGGALGSIGGPGPTRVDYAVRSLGGAPGRELLQGSDVLARAAGRSDLAGQPYSSPPEQEALDTVRRVPGLGNLVGGLVRQSGGQLDADAAARLRVRLLQAQRDARDRLQANPAYVRLPQEQKNELLRRELDRIRRQLEAEAKAATDLRRLQRARAQR